MPEPTRQPEKNPQKTQKQIEEERNRKGPENQPGRPAREGDRGSQQGGSTRR